MVWKQTSQQKGGASRKVRRFASPEEELKDEARLTETSESSMFRRDRGGGISTQNRQASREHLLQLRRSLPTLPPTQRRVGASRATEQLDNLEGGGNRGGGVEEGADATEEEPELPTRPADDSPTGPPRGGRAPPRMRQPPARACQPPPPTRAGLAADTPQPE
uniref:Uncharacterized protein n=1 Tax=Oryza nivara TaxID=4536 RepID=A0A0E0GXC5_ORYNI